MALKSNLTIPTTKIDITVVTKVSGGSAGDSGEKEQEESVSSELNHNESISMPKAPSIKLDRKGSVKEEENEQTKRKNKKDKKKMARDSRKNLKKKQHIPITISNENSVSDFVEIEKLQEMKESNVRNGQKKDLVMEIDENRLKFHGNESNNPKTNDSFYKKVSVYQFVEEKQRISLSKERRAARTLGIIMGKRE